MPSERKIILAIETSCDETSVAIVERQKNRLSDFSNIVSSQVALHAQFGGVVPNLAAREHLKNGLPVLETAIKEAKIGRDQIDAIAVTQGPGLIPALTIGVTMAKALSYAWKKPLIPVHHIAGHIYANFLSLSDQSFTFPILSLVVSGGHTQLVWMSNHHHYEIIGETQDDAAGEAFDKVARILNLGYPGGPIISQKAELAENNFSDISLPRPMLNSPDFNFSFSGLKTAVLYLIKKNEARLSDPAFVPAVCREFENATVEVLLEKTINATQKYHPKTVLLAGGVSANRTLRESFKQAFSSRFPEIRFSSPELKYTGDNAAMIAAAALFKENSLEVFAYPNGLSADSNLLLEK